MITRYLRVPFVAVTLLAASLGGALATGSGTSGTTGGSPTGGGATTVTTTGTTDSPTSGTVTSVPAPHDDRTDWGWLGLAGLGGLLRRRETHHTTAHVAPASTTTRM